MKEFFFAYSRCSLTAPCGAVQFIHLFFPAQIISFACVYVAIVRGLLSNNETGFKLQLLLSTNMCCQLLDKSDTYNNSVMNNHFLTAHVDMIEVIISVP